MSEGTLLIRDSKGKKLCEVSFIKSFVRSWRDIGTRKVWTDIDSATKVVWHQALVIMLFFLQWQDKRLSSSSSWEDLAETMEQRKSGFLCVACGKDSVYANKLLGRVDGFVCRNEACSMHNALIPSKLLSYLYEMPIGLQREFEHMILMNEGGSDRRHWGNYTILAVQDGWDDINDYIIQQARSGQDWQSMLREIGWTPSR